MQPRRTEAPPPELVSRVTEALGREPVEWLRPHTGLSPAHRFVLRLADGGGAFAKAAVDDASERELRVEHEILSRAPGDFAPRPLAWRDEAGERPLLLIEDLSAAHWPADHRPVCWRPGQVERLFDTLGRVAACAPPPSLPAAEAGFEPRWPGILRQPEPLLDHGLCSEQWLRAAGPALADAEALVPLAGEALVHNDVRSDNLCFLGDRTVLVDWGSALRGHPEHDLANALTTLPLEGGPEPFGLLPEGGAWAAYHAGRTARRLGLGSGGLGGREEAPEWFRKVLQRITAIALDWAARSLDLPPRDGHHWREI